MREQSTFARTISRQGIRRNPVWEGMRKNSAEKAQVSSAPLLTTQELTKEVQAIVLAFPTRDVVEDTQGSLRAIENVRNGESGMSLKHFVNLCRANPRARALAGPLLGFGCETDPNVVQAISVLMNQLVRQHSDVGADAASPCHGDLFEAARGGHGQD